MLRFIHAADLHLDAPFAALSPEQARGRRAEQRQLLSRLAALCEEEKADLLLLSGDLLDGERVYYETTQALAKALGSVKARVFLAPGNHDFYSPRSPYASVEWPENVHLFTSDTVEEVELSELGCTVCGAAFTAPWCDTSPLKGYTAPRDGKKRLMVLHADVEGKGRYGSITREDIAVSGLAYLALGHVHACSGLQREGETFWAYPGCAEGRGFDELGDKGVLSGVLRDDGSVEVRFVPLAAHRYRILTVDLTGAENAAAALSAALPGDASADLARIILTGERGEETLDLEALTALAAPCFSAVTLRDETRPGADVWARLQEDTLTGLFLREMRARLEGAGDDTQRRLAERAVRFGLAALENREEADK